MERKQTTCAERVGGAWDSHRDDLKRLFEAEKLGLGEYREPEDDDDDETRAALATLCELGPLNEYGLCFEYEPPMADDPEAFWRFLISTGGPGSEMRFFASSPDAPCYKIEFWFLDWFDGASLNVTDDEVARGLWNWFQGFGAPRFALERAEE
jgi:hypothetical protein